MNLNEKAREQISDGQLPNIYFLSVNGNVFLSTPRFEEAYTVWSALPTNVETCLEDRLTGTICTTEPKEDGAKELITIDDSIASKKWIDTRTKELRKIQS